MQYGVKPEGMTPEEWTIECQCRHVAREMRKGVNRSARLAIFEVKPGWGNTYIR